MLARIVSYGILVIGGIGTVVALALSAGGIHGLLSGFTLWALLPYVMLVIAAAIACTRSSIIVVLVVSAVSVAYALYGYAGLVFDPSGSTAALGFLFLPLYQLLVAAVVVGFAIERRVHARRNI